MLAMRLFTQDASDGGARLKAGVLLCSRLICSQARRPCPLRQGAWTADGKVENF